MGDTDLIKPRQVSPLPVGPGGKNQIKQQLNNTNLQLAMLSAQAIANSKYDPPVPKPVTKQVILEKFTSNSTSIPLLFGVIGGLFVVYGLVAK
jgi:hypothetical protein